MAAVLSSSSVRKRCNLQKNEKQIGERKLKGLCVMRVTFVHFGESIAWQVAVADRVESGYG